MLKRIREEKKNTMGSQHKKELLLIVNDTVELLQELFTF